MKKIVTAACAALTSLQLLTPVQAFEMPETISDYVYMIDRDTGQVLYDKASTEEMYPASMTKLMTAYIACNALEDKDEEIEITYDMIDGLYEANAVVVGYLVGESVSVTDLLYGTLLPSGADAAYALAYAVSGSEERFVDRMNEEAQKLGMNSTHFTNPTGLHDDDLYSTCQDIALLLEACMEVPLLRTIMEAETYEDEAGRVLESTVHKYGSRYGIEGLIGGKTGFTYPAAYCLATCAEYEGINVLLVTAHAESDDYVHPAAWDHHVLYDEIFTNYEHKTLLKGGELLKEITIDRYFRNRTVSVYTKEDVYMLIPKGADVQVHYDLPDTIKNGLEDQTLTYPLTITVNGEEVYADTLEVFIPKESNIVARIAMRFNQIFFSEKE